MCKMNNKELLGTVISWDHTKAIPEGASITTGVVKSRLPA